MQLILWADTRTLLPSGVWVYSPRLLFMQTPNCNQDRVIWSFNFIFFLRLSTKSGKCFFFFVGWVFILFLSLCANLYAFMRLGSNESVLKRKVYSALFSRLITSFMMALEFFASSKRVRHSMVKLKASKFIVTRDSFSFYAK
jgi:hypothetical protein